MIIDEILEIVASWRGVKRVEVINPGEMAGAAVEAKAQLAALRERREAAGRERDELRRHLGPELERVCGLLAVRRAPAPDVAAIVAVRPGLGSADPEWHFFESADDAADFWGSFREPPTFHRTRSIVWHPARPEGEAGGATGTTGTGG